MKILVCIKQVPDTVEVKIDPKTGTLIRDGVPSIINHDDKTGIEAALRIKEQLGGTVTVVSMGPPQADVALREALAMGCDDAYLVSAREFGGSDTYATSGIIAAALKHIGYDLIITGRQAIDGDTAQVGPQIAEKLHLAQVSYVEEVVEAAEDHVVVKRQFEDLKDDLELDMIGLKGSPTNVFKSFTKEVKGAGTILNGLTPEEAVDAIVKKLEEKFII